MGTCEDIDSNKKAHRSTWLPKREIGELIRSNEEEEDSLVHQFKNNVTIRSNDGSDDPSGSSRLPLRPYAEDCPFYLKSGTCEFGFACKFNHPAKRPNQFWKDKNKDTDSEDITGQPWQTECKYYLTARGCKYGQSCRYSHSKADSEFAHLDLNFLGLPVRLGEKECPFYMRNGSCGYGAHCRFHHPDPTTCARSDPRNPNLSDESVEEIDHYLGKWNSESVPFHFPVTSQLAQTSEPSPVISDSSVYVDNEFAYPMNIVPQGAYQNHEHNGYQVPNYFQDRTLHFHPTPALNSSMEIAELPMQVEDFPQRPGQPNCDYFMKTGGCKFKSACWYHHPKFQTLITSLLSDKGLPLRPGKKICWHYEKSGFCKYGPTCLFDHPVNHDSQLLQMSTY